MSQLLGPVKLHLEELVIERCSDFLSRGVLHFSPLAAVSRLRVSNPLLQVADLSGLASISAAKHAYRLLLAVKVSRHDYLRLHVVWHHVTAVLLSKQTS